MREKIKLNNLSSYNITKEYLANKNFSYLILLHMVRYFNYDISTEQWYYDNITFVKIKEWTKMSAQKIKSNLEYGYYEFDKTKYILDIKMENPSSNFTKVSKKEIEVLMNTNEMTVRFFLLLKGWKYKTIKGLTQEMILELIGYSKESANNKKKLTLARRLLEDQGLITSERVNEGRKDYLVYTVVK